MFIIYTSWPKKTRPTAIKTKAIGIYILNGLKNKEVLVINEKKLIVVKTSTLQALDPKNNLRKGFSITRNENGQLIKSIDDLESGDHIFTEIFDGEIKSSIKKVSINEKIKED